MMPQAKAKAAIKRGSLPPQYSGRTPAETDAPLATGEANPQQLAEGCGRSARFAMLLQAVQVFGADADRPGQQFILRESEPGVRVVVADAVEGRLRFVIGNPQQERAAAARDQRS